MSLLSNPAVPWKEFVKSGLAYVRNSGEDVGEPGERIGVVDAGGKFANECNLKTDISSNRQGAAQRMPTQMARPEHSEDYQNLMADFRATVGIYPLCLSAQPSA